MFENNKEGSCQGEVKENVECGPYCMVVVVEYWWYSFQCRLTQQQEDAGRIKKGRTLLLLETIYFGIFMVNENAIFFLNLVS